MKKLLLLLLISLSVHAEPIEMVVTATPGGPEDTLIRKLSTLLENKTNLKFVVFNKPGASKAIGYSYVESSTKPTLITSSDSILEHLVINSVEPIFYIGSSSIIWFVSKDSNFKTMDDLINLSQQREVRISSAGTTTQSYKGAQMFCEKIIKCLMVPYKSNGPETMSALLNGTLDAVTLPSYGNLAYLQNDRFKSIFVMLNTKNRFINAPILPDKFKHLEKQDWTLLFAKNLSDSDKKTIVDVLKSVNTDFYAEMGFQYSFKDPKKVLHD
jgi:tripartite-type tricarboxylate transporter receptor subunit TctC